jgi:hypothetical protein
MNYRLRITGTVGVITRVLLFARRLVTPGCCLAIAGECVRSAGDDPPLAPRPDNATLDVRTPDDRPTSDAAPVRNLVLRFVRENPTWGYRKDPRRAHASPNPTRAPCGRSSRRPGYRPNLAPSASESLRSSLRALASGIIACDFLSVDTVCAASTCSASPSGGATGSSVRAGHTMR